MAASFNALTLNMWGIKHFSKDRELRFKHLASALNENEYDLVALQEVWVEEDYEFLKSVLEEKYPFTVYFSSGLIGSGCCLFSKHQIEEVYQCRYALNGSPIKFHHGDWFGGKSVGMARIKYGNYELNAYVTHLHANYSESIASDEYLAHRISQAFELSQFIRNTSYSADFVILMGDLNLKSDELGFKILKEGANLLDAFTESKEPHTNEPLGQTCNLSSNPYTSAIDKKFNPNGARIDYILYKTSNKIDVKTLKCETCMTQIPGLNIHYSDHKAVCAQFSIEPSQDTPSLVSVDSLLSNTQTENNLKNDLQSALSIINKGLVEIKTDQWRFLMFSLAAFIFIFILNCDVVFSLLKNVLIFAFILFSIWFSLIHKNIERKHLMAVKNSMEFVLKFKK